MKTFLTLLMICAVFFIESCIGKKENQQNRNMDILVGTYTDKTSEGIYMLSFNPENGSVVNKGLVAATPNPSYLAVSKNGRHLYCVNENDSGGVSSFTWDSKKKLFGPVSQQYSEGAFPCYIDLNYSEGLLAVANYVTGNIAIYNVDEEGHIEAGPRVCQHEGKGPVEDRQEGPHAHYSLFENEGGYLYAVDLGIDKILAYPLDNDDKVGNPHTAIETKPGDGPRHLAFHPSKKYVYVVNELSTTVTAMKTDLEKGKFSVIDRVGTLPDDFAGHNQCADIHVSSNGKFLYASNRGHDSIAVFSISEDGKLKLVGIEPTRGKWPRNFILSPDDNFLLVANQNSDNITVFKIDLETGMLSFTGSEVEISKPVCLKFF